MSVFPVDWVRDTANLGKPTTVRITDGELAQVDELAKRLNATRSTLMWAALRYGIQAMAEAEGGSSP